MMMYANPCCISFYNEIFRQKKFNLPQSQKKKKTKAKGYKKNLEI